MMFDRLDGLQSLRYVDASHSKIMRKSQTERKLFNCLGKAIVVNVSEFEQSLSSVARETRAVHHSQSGGGETSEVPNGGPGPWCDAGSAENVLSQ